MIRDEAEQKGTGRWTAQSALELGVPITAITEAVFARALSGRPEQRKAASEAFKRAESTPKAAGPGELDKIRDALYASKIAAYAQGFEQLAVASKEYKWDLNLGLIATIWRGGCIIRAAFLDRIREVYEAHPDAPSLLLQTYVRDAVVKAEQAWRDVVVLAIQNRVAVPPSPHRLPISTVCVASVAPPICCKACATISARIPTAVQTGRARSKSAGRRMEPRLTRDRRIARMIHGMFSAVAPGRARRHAARS
jgi:6-phosphogluconate dehydrogenase, C-terminal domain